MNPKQPLIALLAFFLSTVFTLSAKNLLDTARYGKQHLSTPAAGANAAGNGAGKTYTYTPYDVSQLTDKSLKGQYDAILMRVYHYQAPMFNQFFGSVTDTLKKQHQLLLATQAKLAAANQKVEALKNEYENKTATLTDSQDEINFLGLSMSKLAYSIMMWVLVLGLGAALALVIMLSASTRHEAAYRIKLYEELSTEFQAYKTKANDKEKRLARELQTERNKVEDLMARKG